MAGVRSECRNTELAEFGIRYAGTGERWAQFKTKTLNCTIDSTQCSSGSYGMGTGLIMAAEPTGNGVIQFRINEVDTIGNVIKGNRSEGVLIKASAGTGGQSQAHFTINEFSHNEIRKNGGAGVRLDWGTVGEQRYINFSSMNNLVVDNLRGFYLENYVDGSATESGFIWSVLDTVANNTYEGYYTATTALDNLPNIADGIVFGNNGTGAEHNFPSGWVATTEVAYSCFEGLSGGTGNISGPPLFIDDANGNYHLDSTAPGVSPCIDAGTGTPTGPASLPSQDIDRQTREQDSDDNGSVIVDIGCDEVPDPNP